MDTLKLALIITIVFSSQLFSCAGGSGLDGEGHLSGTSSEPINSKEVVEYKQAIIRCHKTGGTRVVKIRGVLRCF